MAAREMFTDDYVAEVLKRDAALKPDRYSGASEFGSSLRRPKTSAPKANTRFLRNIIRETDSHNAMLIAREKADSRRKYRDLDRRVEERPHTRRGDRGVDAQKNRRKSENSTASSSRVDKEDNRRHREKRSSRAERDGKHVHSRFKSDTDRERKSRRRRGSDDRSRSPKRRDSHNYRESRKSSRSKRSIDAKTAGAEQAESDSEPLDAVIGPRPPPTTLPRGRGALKTSSMDDRFDPKYDPKADVALDSNEESDDWDMALEALRDRTKWRKQGAERLRAAGFTDEEVHKWENGNGKKRDEEKDFTDVRWAKKGQSREWDRGKTVDGDRIDVVPEWGRLKGT